MWRWIKRKKIYDIVRIIGNIFSYKNYEFDKNKNNDGQLKKTTSNKSMSLFDTICEDSKLTENKITTISWFKNNFPNVRK